MFEEAVERISESVFWVWEICGGHFVKWFFKSGKIDFRRNALFYWLAKVVKVFTITLYIREKSKKKPYRKVIEMGSTASAPAPPPIAFYLTKKKERTAKKMNEQMDRFLTDCCETGNEYRQRSGELYTFYRKWCLRSREYIHSTKEFYSEIHRRRYEKHRTNKGNIICGLRLREGSFVGWGNEWEKEM